MRIVRLLPIASLLFGLGAALAADAPQASEADNWTKIGGTDHFAVLINPPSIKHAKVGKTRVVKAWVLYDFAEPTTNAAGTFRSAKILEYFKCADKVSSQKSLVFFTDSMGGGDVVKAVTHLDREMKYVPMSPGSADAEVGTVACGVHAKS